MKTYYHPLLFMLSIAFLSGCSWSPEGVTPVTDFEIDRYLGTWYEIARFDHSFEKELDNVSAEYEKRDDGGIKVVNRGFDKNKMEWKQAIGKAYFIDNKQTGRLKVSFFGPFYSGYNILDLDKKHYQFALVCGPNRNYLWILSRTRSIDTKILNVLLDKARHLGFDVSKLIFVKHDKPAKVQ